MEWWIILSVGLVALLSLFMSGLPIYLCFLVINVVGVLLAFGQAGFGMFINSILESTSSESLTAVALFIAVYWLVLRWLWPYLGKFRLPVVCYMALFCTTVTAAWSPLLHGAPLRPSLLLAAGATAFFFSDLAVARQRFVHESPWNKTWGLPLYFGGQLLIAWSAAT